jgi:PKD repeat protein
VVFTGEPFKANAWSVAPGAGPNVEGGAEIGGNFWGAPDGTGFSQQNPDGDGDGFVDYPYQVAEQNVDEFPLAPRGSPALPVTRLPGGASTPTDPDRDGVYDDVNGNGRADFADVVLYFNSMVWVAANEPVSAFDFNGNGRIDFADVVRLFNRI